MTTVEINWKIINCTACALIRRKWNHREIQLANRFQVPVPYLLLKKNSNAWLQSCSKVEAEATNKIWGFLELNIIQNADKSKLTREKEENAFFYVFAKKGYCLSGLLWYRQTEGKWSATSDRTRQSKRPGLVNRYQSPIAIDRNRELINHGKNFLSSAIDWQKSITIDNSCLQEYQLLSV